MGNKTWLLLALFLFLMSGVNAIIYINAAGDPGFSLDDAWIHQVYARNLGLNGRMEFNPSVRSSGNTPPGWTALLALGFILHVQPIPWAYVCGSIFAVLTALAATNLSWRWFHYYYDAWIYHWIGPLFLLVSFTICIYLTWRKAGLHEVLRVFNPGTIVMAISLAIFGLWPMHFQEGIKRWQGFNYSLWLSSIPVGMALLATSFCCVPCVCTRTGSRTHTAK